MTYESHGQIPGPGAVISCHRCGNLVRQVFQSKHDAFHAELDRLRTEFHELRDALGGDARGQENPRRTAR